jgi:hypothetical protein
MRPDDPARDPRNTAHKHHPAPALALHSRQTQLCEQVRGAAVDAPCALEDIHGDLVGGLDARQAVGRAGVVDEDCGGSEDRNNVFVEFADLRCVVKSLLPRERYYTCLCSRVWIGSSGRESPPRPNLPGPPCM